MIWAWKVTTNPKHMFPETGEGRGGEKALAALMKEASFPPQILPILPGQTTSRLWLSFKNQVAKESLSTGDQAGGCNFLKS